MDNLSIWNKVDVTDPAYTKPIAGSRKGGGTSPNPVYLYKKATKLFGPVGKGWGWEIIDESIIDGKQLRDGQIEKIHIAKISVWYMFDGEKVNVPPQFGATVFIGENSNGTYSDDDAPKKTITDGVTKSLSCLGFSADIFMGHYDDVKYVTGLKIEKDLESLRKVLTLKDLNSFFSRCEFKKELRDEIIKKARQLGAEYDRGKKVFEIVVQAKAKEDHEENKETENKPAKSSKAMENRKEIQSIGEMFEALKDERFVKVFGDARPGADVGNRISTLWINKPLGDLIKTIESESSKAAIKHILSIMDKLKLLLCDKNFNGIAGNSPFESIIELANRKYDGELEGLWEETEETVTEILGELE